ncbi:unnamed protein product [Schistosoma mattheei]|uniref:Uncharacterized protein n=1 Tax=Schistosoma mattheei TaxID=31246 RepID=A0A183PF68_9TREM|nr:unnamed protein product [Schistosoma mattheei]
MIAFSSTNENSRFYSIFIMILNIMLEHIVLSENQNFERRGEQILTEMPSP